MGKLSPKETFIVVIVVNILVYVLGYQLLSGIFTPVIENATADREAAYAENEQLTADIAANEGYLSQIATLTEERKSLFGECFPSSETEIIHKFINEKAKASGLGLSSATIDEKVDVNISEDGNEIVSPYMMNTVEFAGEGSYDQIINFLTDIEELNRTSAVRGLSIEPEEGGEMSVNAKYEFFCVDKEDDKDKIFDYEFKGSEGKSELKLGRSN